MYNEAFSSRDDLRKYGDDALLLFALILKYGIDDIDALASESLTEGFDDKKADLVYINADENFAVIAQSYFCREPKKRKSAPSNKASDLNTAVTWLISQEETKLPEDIKSAAIQLRNALKDGDLERIELWYVHNLPESQNVASELKAVERTLDSLVKRYFPEIKINISSIEVGEKTLNEWYQSIKTPILVDDRIELSIDGGYEKKTREWSCFSTSLSCATLYTLFKKHQKKLFSANIRDYLGSKRSDSNINWGIKKTVDEEPDNFWIYNNGITVITHSYEHKATRHKLIVKGFSIVNGAQTTGSIGSLTKTPNDNTFVPARFVRCTDQEIISSIVRFNNSQNKITAADFRSNDRIQEKLRKEFERIDGTYYTGGRRGGAEDAIKRNPYLLPSDTVAQTLAAFHQDPAVAYNRKSEVWISDKLYSTYFNEKTNARNICFVYSLFICIMDQKAKLWKKLKDGQELLDTEKDNLNFLRLRGSNYILIAAISSCLEILISKPIPDKFALFFKENVSPFISKSYWNPIVESLLSFNNQLEKPTETSLKNDTEVKQSIAAFKSLVQATLRANAKIYKEFSSKVSS